MSGVGGDDAASTARRETTARDDIATFVSAKRLGHFDEMKGKRDITL